ncbi:MAG TPA: hypothetical protein P5519_08875 [Spirochaetia bacterium]|nr:hypothetical protein [Spirochaetales bacterium]HPD80825.1 hypothetical protein [Spirochaetales bacterium]HQK33780.1 hypothetical protein [Spirochaetales bacterium]HRS65985.1 hypothetical protein [Spirochaetia bacterium]HRV29405.1 hypothetical protein [Spirochaetia bacterium]
MFNIAHKLLGSYKAIVLTDERGAQAVIVRELGGMVHELILPVLSADGVLAEYQSVLRSDSLEELSTNPYYRGRFMAPFCGRIPEGIYRFNGRLYKLPINMPAENNALHGFFYRMEMQTLSSCADESKAELRLHHIISSQDDPGYPFTLQIIITYTLDAQGFCITVTAANMGSEDLPLTMGWHPYFKLPGKISDWIATIDADLYYPTTNKLLPTGALLSVGGTEYDFRKGRPLVHTSLDTCLAFPSFVQLEHVQTHTGISLEIDRKFFNKIHLFIPPERDSIALEPVTAAGAAFIMPHLGLTVLSADASKSGWIRIQTFNNKQ